MVNSTFASKSMLVQVGVYFKKDEVRNALPKFTLQENVSKAIFCLLLEFALVRLLVILSKASSTRSWLHADNVFLCPKRWSKLT